MMVGVCPLGGTNAGSTIAMFGNSKSVLPVKAGIQKAGVFRWIPAYAGMTESVGMTTRTQE